MNDDGTNALTLDEDGAADDTGTEPADIGPWRAGTHRSETGCLRFRGKGKRGPAPVSAADDQDLRAALDELASGRAALAAAHRVPRQEQRVRREAFAGALAKLSLASRFLDDVLLRRGGVPGDLDPPT